jgi:hypothetical protein
VGHFWPDFRGWLGQVTDTRVQERIVYDRAFLTWMGLLVFVLKLGSRRQVRFELDSPQALANLNRLSGQEQATLAHSDTLEHFLGHVPPAAYHRLRRQMIQRLLRMKVLDDERLFGHVLLVIDGTGQLTFRTRHCPHCLEQTHGEQTRYYHPVLEAKLVTPSGLALSVGSEFIENTAPQASKQDCELKAFRRLAAQLAADFPQLRLGLLLDGLYANGTVLTICEQHDWKYIITFKEGSLPAVWHEYQTLRELCPHNRLVRPATPDPCARAGQRPPQTFAWVENLEYQDDQHRPHRFHAFECREPTDPATRGAGHTTRLFAWLTNFTLRAENVARLANHGGRLRWKIENEGFNLQKNGGFALEHAYSTQPQPIKNWYLLLQMAHLIVQLFERGNLLGQAPARLFGSLRSLARRLAESLRHQLISAESLDPSRCGAMQIRLNSS